MTAENFDAVVRTLLEFRPFLLFTIELNSGERIEIDHPNALSYRDGFAHFIGPGKKLSWFDHNSVNKISEGRVEAEQS